MIKFNPETHILGKLCKRGHDYKGYGLSVRYNGSGHNCVECHKTWVAEGIYNSIGTKQSRAKLSQERLKELFSYIPSTGEFFRNVNIPGGGLAGSLAGCISKDTGYIHIAIGRNRYKAHRLAFLYMEGYFPEHSIDHINRDRRDNRWSNLRHANQSCNMRNKCGQSNNTSGVTGVSWHKANRKWLAKIKTFEKQLYIGTFNNFNDAVIARWKAEVSHNFPNCCALSSAYEYLVKNNLMETAT